MRTYKIFLILMMLALALAGCGKNPTTTPSTSTPTRVTLPSATAAPTQIPPTATFQPAETGTATPAPSATPSPTLTQTPSPTPIPTYIKLRGEVLVGQAVCHYGPGAPYLYKYGVIQGNRLEILARDPRGIYVEVQAIGGNNPCWVKAEYMKINGDVMSAVRPVDPETEVRLPMSPYYGPVASVSASRSGDKVTVFWSPVVLKAGDDSEQFDYLIEAWVCRAGELVFTPVGSYQAAAEIQDESGCAQPSHARLYAVEKHGYTRWVEIPWPQP